MKLKAYSIFDTKALSYSPPFFQQTDAAAVRMLQDLVDDPTTTVGRHPRDFTLYCVGDFDGEKGIMTPHAPIVHICEAVSLVKPASMPLFEKSADGRDYFAMPNGKEAQGG